MWGRDVLWERYKEVRKGRARKVHEGSVREGERKGGGG